MSDAQPKSSRYVTCRCQHCDKGIEFDASEFKKGENQNAECPHCHLETIIFVPPWPVASTPKPERQSKFAFLSIVIGGCILVVAYLTWLITVSHDKNKATNSEVTTNFSPIQPTVAAAPTPQPSPPPAPKTEEEQIDALKAKPLLMSSDEKTARDNILKALLDISSATAVGVNRNSYGDLLTKALSTLTFEKN